MIGTIFQFGSDIIEVRIIGEQCLFKSSQYSVFSPIERLKLDKKGVIKEFPDLKDNLNWREQAIERFKNKLKSYQTEKERMDYVINDLKKYGYKPLYQQQKGFRPRRLS